MLAGFQYASELFYPLNENVSTFLLNSSAQIFGIILIFSMQYLEGHLIYPTRKYTYQSSNWFCAFLGLIGFICQFLVQGKLKRLLADRSPENQGDIVLSNRVSSVNVSIVQ
jgi:FLVCR family feline leukemia virus subgroup C receptor-related protein